MENIKHMLRSKIVKDCPAPPEDIDVAEKIFGPDTATLKGKFARQKLKPVRADLVAVPKEFLTKHHNLELCMDIVFTNGLPMFTGIDWSIKFQSLVPLDSRTASELHHSPWMWCCAAVMAVDMSSCKSFVTKSLPL